MAVTIELPDEVARRLRAVMPNLETRLKEAVALELFRKGRLSHHALANILGMDRFETDAYLQHHGVEEGSVTMGDLDEQARTLERVLGQARP